MSAVNKRRRKQQRVPKCHLLHHSNPFLSMGPFQIEVKFYLPFRTIIHYFFSEKEMDWLMEYSKPRLTSSREEDMPPSTFDSTKAKMRYANPNTKGLTVRKAVTLWLNEIAYINYANWAQISRDGQPLEYEVTPSGKDPYCHNVNHKRLNDISKRIELATYLNVTARYGASPYQTTNYGLSGMVVSHLDPWGYEKGVELSKERYELVRSGDYIATFMGWFADTQAGGETAFVDYQYEGTVQPRKGSAAFWINLYSCHTKDNRAHHAGCPVLKGSKWILNKWIYSWNQWKSWPCHLEQLKTLLPYSDISP